MKPSPKFLLALAFTLSIGVRAHSQDLSRGQFQSSVSSHRPVSSSIPMAPAPPAWSNHGEVTRYATGFDGDHSLEAATVAEQVFARHTLYTIRLQFASGAEQSVAVTAPPGGLQPEMRDMSGDSVPNDVVLSSTLFHVPLVVLLNDGHDHLTVAISPDSLASGEDRASVPRQTHRISALVSSGFKAGGLASGGEPFHPRLQENHLSPIVQIAVKHADCTSSSVRAPPAPVTNI
jgi:hypothetical protein